MDGVDQTLREFSQRDFWRKSKKKDLERYREALPTTYDEYQREKNGVLCWDQTCRPLINCDVSFDLTGRVSSIKLQAVHARISPDFPYHLSDFRANGIRVIYLAYFGASPPTLADSNPARTCLDDAPRNILCLCTG